METSLAPYELHTATPLQIGLRRGTLSGHRVTGRRICKVAARELGPQYENGDRAVIKTGSDT